MLSVRAEAERNTSIATEKLKNKPYIFGIT